MIYCDNTPLVSAAGIEYKVLVEYRQSRTKLRIRTIVNDIITVVDDRPSVVYYDNDGFITNESWLNGSEWVDRGDLPNEIEYQTINGTNTKLGEFWLTPLGSQSRYLKPVVIVYNPDGSIIRKEYYKDGVDISDGLMGFIEGTPEFEFQWEML